jgi:outer membrane protein assembly factor BamB
MNQRQRFLLLALGLLYAVPASSWAGDWPGWRGATGMGHANEKDLPLTWDARTGANILWKAPLRGNAPDSDASSPGHSCPIVWRERVFVTTAIWPAGMSFRDKVIAKHRVHCFRASDGKQLWETTVPDGKCRVNNPWHGYATPTPVTDGEHVFALFGSSVVVCVDHVYRVSKPGVLRCWKADTGHLVYAERLSGVSTMASPIATADGRIYVACAAKSYVLKVGPKPEVLGGGALHDGGDYQTPTPAVSEGRLIIKGKTHLWCIGSK